VGSAGQLGLTSTVRYIGGIRLSYQYDTFRGTGYGLGCAQQLDNSSCIRPAACLAAAGVSQFTYTSCAKASRYENVGIVERGHHTSSRS